MCRRSSTISRLILCISVSGCVSGSYLGRKGDPETDGGDPAEVAEKSFPAPEIAGDAIASGDLTLVGQLLQNPDADRNSGNWVDIDPVSGRSADGATLDVDNLPGPGATGFTLQQGHWSGIENSNNSWQLQLFAERHVRFEPETGQWVDLPHAADGGIRIRSNPLLISLTRAVP